MQFDGRWPSAAAALAMVVSLGGCDLAVGPAKRAVAHNVKDPASAQFRAIRHLVRTTTDGGKLNIVCGEMNAKNSYGAYAGFTPFYYVVSHAPPGRPPTGAQPRYPNGYSTVATTMTDGDGAKIRMLCNRRDHLPVQASDFDYGWVDPCSEQVVSRFELGYLNWLATQRFGKDLACEAAAYSPTPMPDYILSLKTKAELEALTAKLQRIRPAIQFFVDEGQKQVALEAAREAEDKKRPKDDD